MVNNILISYYSIAGNSKYQDLANSLYNNNNNVLQLNIKNITNNDILEVKSFNPNIIFSYNNSLPERIFLEYNCPILIIDADNPEMFFQKDLLKKNFDKENIYYLCYQSSSLDLYKNTLGIDVTKKYIDFPPFSNFIKNNKSKQDINISFIGSNFYSCFEEMIKNTSGLDLPQLSDCISHIKKNYYDPNVVLKYKKNIIANAKHIHAGQERISYLKTLSDLGLKIYSNSNWKKELFFIDSDIAKCYQNKAIVTSKENNDLYNRSKISINLSHPQAVSSFSWRVPDIMASNSCLVMENKPDWHKQFGKHISQEVIDLIIYKDQHDMRNKVIKLLNNEQLRKKCVKECNIAIEKSGRFYHGLRKIENLIKIKIIDNKVIDNKVIDNKVIDNKVIDNKGIEVKTKKIIDYIFKNFKALFYLMLIFIHFISFKFLINKYKVNKFLQKLIKH